MKRGVLIYSETCPKCRLARAVIGALDLRRQMAYLPWQRASTGVLLRYYRSDEVPYNYMWLAPDGALYEGGAAILPILKALLG
tara:strand:- start:513 stop:761 length:249 start_codon:yes stop_codon:yes gene_type:complete